MSKFAFTYKVCNPLFYHLRSAMRDKDIRIILNIGGSSSGKSYTTAQIALYTSLEQGCNILILRKVGSSISRSIYMDFKAIIRKQDMGKIFSCYQHEIRNNLTGSIISFTGLDDAEKIKGISQYKYIIADELTEFDEEDYKQLKKRMRGIEGQQLIANFNPISELHWIKKKTIDAEIWTEEKNYLGEENSELSKLSKITSKHRNQDRIIINPKTGEEEYHPADMLLLKTTYLNNFWVVGAPDGEDWGYYDRQTIADFDKDKTRDYDYYRIYALAEWGVIRTGGEFLYNFDEKRNISEVYYDGSLPIRLSVDNNVLPYISIGFWQLRGDTLTQFHEIAAEEPDNTVTKAAQLVEQYLRKIGYRNILIIHADASTTARNTIDEKKQSFIDKFADVLLKAGFKIKLSLPKKNPSVSLSCEFVNKLLYDRRMIISHTCKKSILDYLNAKRDSNGGMVKKRVRDAKTGQSYEQWGHFTDTLRYVGVYAFSQEYVDFTAVRNRNPIKQNDYKFYESLPAGGSEYTEIYPFINNSMVVISCTYSDSRIFVNNIRLTDSYQPLEDNLVNGEVCVVVNPSNIGTGKEIRRAYENKVSRVRILRDRGRHTQMADRFIPYIKENVYLHKGISENAINNILDYDGTSNYEVVCAMSSLCERIIKDNR